MSEKRKTVTTCPDCWGTGVLHICGGRCQCSTCAGPGTIVRRPIAEPTEIVVRCFEGCGSTEEYANPADHGWLYIGPKCDDPEYNWICPECAKAQGEPTEEPMQELTTCPHGALHTVKCGKCENGGGVGTPRKSKITDEEAGRRLKLIPCMVEITDAYSDSNDTLVAPDITPILSKHFQAVEKERDEWYTVALLLHTALKNNWEHKGHPHCVCQRGTERDAALAAYELKAKEGV